MIEPDDDWDEEWSGEDDDWGEVNDTDPFDVEIDMEQFRKEKESMIKHQKEQEEWRIIKKEKRFLNYIYNQTKIPKVDISIDSIKKIFPEYNNGINHEIPNMEHVFLNGAFSFEDDINIRINTKIIDVFKYLLKYIQDKYPTRKLNQKKSNFETRFIETFEFFNSEQSSVFYDNKYQIARQLLKMYYKVTKQTDKLQKFRYSFYLNDHIVEDVSKIIQDYLPKYEYESDDD